MLLSQFDEELDVWVTLFKQPFSDEQFPPIPKLVVRRRTFFTLDGAVNFEDDLVKNFAHDMNESAFDNHAFALFCIVAGISLCL